MTIHMYDKYYIMYTNECIVDNRNFEETYYFLRKPKIKSVNFSEEQPSSCRLILLIYMCTLWPVLY